MNFMPLLMSVSVQPKTKADQEKMGIALAKLAQEDPTFAVHTDPDMSFHPSSFGSGSAAAAR